MARLGDFISIKTGKLDANAATPDGLYPFFTCSVDTLKIDTYSYDCECVLVAGNGDLNVKYYSGRFDAYQRTYIIESLNKNLLDVYYLYYFLDKYVVTLREQSIGGVIKYIKLGNLTDVSISIPDIHVQKRIVTVLNKLNNLILLRKQQLLKLDELVKSRFMEMFGDPVSDDKNWGFCPLEKNIDSIRYGTSTSPRFSNSGFVFIRATNIKDGYIINDDLKYISSIEAAKIEKCKLNGSEMIIVRSGINAGDTCIVSVEYKGQYAGYDLILVLKQDKINPIFLNSLLNTEYMQKVIKPLTRRAAQPHLNSQQVQGLPIIRVPLDLQNQFAAFVEQVDKSKFEIRKGLEKLEMLKKALMQQYFGN